MEDLKMGEIVYLGRKRCMVAGGDNMPSRVVRLLTVDTLRWIEIDEDTAKTLQRTGEMMNERDGRRMIRESDE